jgi:hypothetical protein
MDPPDLTQPTSPERGRPVGFGLASYRYNYRLNTATHYFDESLARACRRQW